MDFQNFAELKDESSIQAVNERLAYPPDFNPIKQVWCSLKQHFT